MMSRPRGVGWRYSQKRSSGRGVEQTVYMKVGENSALV